MASPGYAPTTPPQGQVSTFNKIKGRRKTEDLRLKKIKKTPG
jgi:hypothetical protein